MKLRVEAGNHYRFNTLITQWLEKRLEEEGGGWLREEKSGERIPFQWETKKDRNLITFLLPHLSPGEKKVFEVEVEKEDNPKKVRIQDKGERIEVWMEDKLFTTFHYSTRWVRPFLFPVYSPSGKLLVRELLENKPGVEHPHHRGIWVGHGDVNGVDNWSEMKGHGYQRVIEIPCIKSGEIKGEISSVVSWRNSGEREILREERKMIFYYLPEGRIIDFTISFSSSKNQVIFGDTKEAGILSVRVNPSMNAPEKGILENSWGGINEEEVWGKRAFWCDYSGPVEGEWWGITIFDHPDNLRSPTYWHARNYGLMTANPFGLSYFLGKGKDGKYILPPKKKLVFRYRLYIHKGKAQEGRVKEKFLDYWVPPTVEWVQ